jgi:hypothetical protein
MIYQTVKGSAIQRQSSGRNKHQRHTKGRRLFIKNHRASVRFCACVSAYLCVCVRVSVCVCVCQCVSM